MEIVITSIALVLAGVGIGVLSGMLGIGGGTIMIPVLRLGGLDALATATSLLPSSPYHLGPSPHSCAQLPSQVGHPAWRCRCGDLVGRCVPGVDFPAWLIMVVAAVIIIYWRLPC